MAIVKPIVQVQRRIGGVPAEDLERVSALIDWQYSESESEETDPIEEADHDEIRAEVTDIDDSEDEVEIERAYEEIRAEHQEEPYYSAPLGEDSDWELGEENVPEVDVLTVSDSEDGWQVYLWDKMAEQLAQVQGERNRQRADDSVRKRLEQQARHIECCDGSVREHLREWLDAITAAQRWTNSPDQLIIEMVGYLSKGSLRTSIADFVEQNPGGVTWNGVKGHVSTVFLAEDEPEHQRSHVEKLRQQPYQDSREYGLKFITAVQKAYTPAELQVPLVMERLVKSFIDGLRDREVRAQVHLARPSNLTAAVTRANNVARAVAMVECTHRNEEAMEISALPMEAAARRKEDENWAVLKELAGSIKGLQKQVGRLEKKSQEEERRPRFQPQEWKKQPRKKFHKPAYNQDGTPNCFACGQGGHIARECPNRAQVAENE